MLPSSLRRRTRPPCTGGVSVGLGSYLLSTRPLCVQVSAHAHEQVHRTIFLQSLYVCLMVILGFPSDFLQSVEQAS